MAEKDMVIETEEKEPVSKNFIEQEIDKDLAEGVYDHVQTRFPPEPNGYLHIGHAKSILLNYGLAQKYNGKFNLRFDDTNPTKEKSEFVESIMADVKWLGADFEDRLFFASNYFEKMYECAVFLIKKGKAFVCDLSAEQIREYRGDFNTPGKESPYRNRSIEENLRLFEEMKEGKYQDGEKVLRAKIDMASPNINMRDPVIYRVAHMHHHNTGNKWCIYPMYDFAHPIEDAVEHITHSICTLEFEDHRPLYDWVVKECEFENPPRQIEFAKLYLTNVVTGKRYIKKLVEDGIVDGWDDPRLVSIAALRRRGYTPESIKRFVELVGVSKANSSVDYAMLEYCIREDLKLKKARMMAVLDPVKLVIDNYPEGQVEELDVPNNLENSELGSRKVPFSREVYIEREDFMEEPPKKYFRMFPGNEVRLMGAYFVKCTGCEKDENGNWYAKQQTKTVAGLRKIDLDDVTLEVLTNWREVQVQNGEDDYVLSRFGKPLCKSTICRIIKRQAEIVDVPKITGKGLRHSHASYLLNVLKMDPLYVSHRLGHADKSTTLNVYSHWYHNDVIGISDKITQNILQSKIF